MYRDNAYYAPTIEIIEVKVEGGICASQTGGEIDDLPSVTAGIEGF